MQTDLLKDFVLTQVHYRLYVLLGEYDRYMHPALRELNNVTKDLYEKIIFKVRADVALNNKEAHELYCVLRDGYEEGHGTEEYYYQSCMTYCYALCKDEILERELRANYLIYTEEQS
jgi:hypothetical protein